MKTPMKKTWAMLSAAVAVVIVVAGVMGCGPKLINQRPVPQQPPTDQSTGQPAVQQQQPPAYQPTGQSLGRQRQPAYQSQQQQTTAQTVNNSPSTPAPAAKTAAIDELDVAIRDASDCLNDNIPKGSKIVILNIESSFANLSEYIIDELIANAIKDKNFSVVDRRQLEAIQAEQKFQMSGAVDDKDALAIGRFFGAQTIVSGAMREMGGRYRMTARALAVQTAVVQSQCNQNITTASSAILTDLANSGGSRPISVTYSGAVTPTAAATPTAQAKTAAPAEPPIQGTMVPGNSLTDKLAWLTRTADSHNTYIVEVNADEKIAPHKFEYQGGINITVVLRGVGGNRTIRLKSNGTMFTIRENVTLILDNNITLMGHSGNDGVMVDVRRGILKMNVGSTITGNTNTNTNGNGAGVHLADMGTFDMSGGTISNNTTSNYGGGVYVENWNANNHSTFKMSGGTISGNNANKSGGGVAVDGTFTMKGGIITGNIAREYAGGICLGMWAAFTKTGGTITGYNSDQTNGNTVKDEDGNILARRGHAVWLHNPWAIEHSKRKETTAGPNVNLSARGSNDTTGDWDN